MTTVVNKKIDKYDVYIGRGTFYSNPFRISVDGSREDVITRYREYFQEQIKIPEFKFMIDKLKDKVLGCWCKPLSCHGDVIVEYLNKGDEK